MNPGATNAVHNESVIEILIAAIYDDDRFIGDYQTDNYSEFPSLNEELLQEDLHFVDVNSNAFCMLPFQRVQHQYYHYTSDINNHVLTVVLPPPDLS